MSKGRKTALVAAIVVAAFLIVVLVIAPRFFRVDRYRPYVVSALEQRMGRRVSIGRLGLTVFPSVTIRIDDLAIGNPPGFPPGGNWLTVKQVHARLDLGALWRHQIVIRSLSLNQPDVILLSNGQGRWNYQSPSGAASRNAPQAAAGSHAPVSDPPSFSLEEISAVSLKDGSLKVESLQPGRNLEPSSVEMTASGVSGNFKDIDFATANASTGAPALPASATGNLTVENLSAANIVATQISSPVLASPTQVSFSDVKFRFYGGKGEGAIQLNLAGAVQKYTAQGSVSGVNAAKLLDAFPQARGQLTGTVAGRFVLSAISGGSSDFSNSLAGNGTVTVRQGRLPGLRIDKTLLQLAHVAEIKAASGDPSAFSLIAVDWRLDGHVITTRSVRMEGNGIIIDGSGSVHLPAPGRLDYQGVAHIAAVTNPLTNILADISGALYRNGNLTLPFVVTGTIQKPIFRLKENRMLPNPAGHPGQQPQAIQDILKLFQRKKQ